MRRTVVVLVLLAVAGVSLACADREGPPPALSTVIVPVSADTDPAQLRTELTAAVMAPRPWVLGEPVGQLPSDLADIVDNPRVRALAGDERAAVGGTVRDDPSALIRSRAIGTKGLIVSLTNRRTEAANLTVDTARLGLSGTIRAVDAWTGSSFTSVDGKLGGLVAAGDSLLLEIV